MGKCWSALAHWYLSFSSDGANHIHSWCLVCKAFNRIAKYKPTISLKSLTIANFPGSKYSDDVYNGYIVVKRQMGDFVYWSSPTW